MKYETIFTWILGVSVVLVFAMILYSAYVQPVGGWALWVLTPIGIAIAWLAPRVDAEFTHQQVNGGLASVSARSGARDHQESGRRL